MLAHGTKTAENTGGARPASVDRTSLAVIIGTADNADASVYPLNTPVLIAGDKTLAAKLDTVGTALGTLPDAIRAIFEQQLGALVVIRVAADADPTTQTANIIGGTSSDGINTGIEVIRDVQALFGIKPTLFAMPGFGDNKAALTALNVMTERMKGFAFGDCPGTTYAGAVAYKSNFGDRRLELCWPPQTNVHGRDVALSAYRLGLELKKNASPADGYSASASNRLIKGIVSSTVNISFDDGEDWCMANLLNFNRISTVINDGGRRSWGNLSCSADPKWQFSCHVVVNDKLASAVQEALRWARDAKISAGTFVEDVVDTIENMLQAEKNAGHLYGFSVWADPALNTPDSIMAGKFYLDCDFTAPGINQEMSVGMAFVNDYANIVFS